MNQIVNQMPSDSLVALCVMTLNFAVFSIHRPSVIQILYPTASISNEKRFSSECLQLSELEQLKATGMFSLFRQIAFRFE